MTQFESWSLCGQYALIIIAVVGAYLTIRQLKIAATAAFLQSEVALFEALRRIDEASAAMVELNGKRKAGMPITDEDLQAAQMRFRGAIQNYLNSLDRLCSTIINKIIKEKQARLEYDLVLRAAVTNYQSEIPDFDLHFPNIVALRRKWRF